MIATQRSTSGRPKVDYELRTLGRDRNEVGALLVRPALESARDHALGSLLALNGLRISEAFADIDDLDFERGHRTRKILRKGGKHAVIPLAPRTSRAIELYIGERTTGPILLGAEGGRYGPLRRQRTVKRLARRTGITRRISPPRPRHSPITAALDAASPFATSRRRQPLRPPYNQALRPGRRSLDPHVTYIVATFLAGASR